jgi:DNA-binding CsgD family transcriptional regulator
VAFDLVAAFAAAASARDLPVVASAAVESLIGVAGFTCAVAEAANLSLVPSSGWFESVSLASFCALQRDAGEQLRQAVGALGAGLKRRTCLDVVGHFGESAIRSSELVARWLRPCAGERVLLGLPRHDGRLVAILAGYRSLRSRGFSARDRLLLERICELYAQRLVALTPPGGHPLAAILELIEDHVRHTFAGLFDAEGRILWLSEVSAAHLGQVRHGLQRFLVPRTDELETIRALARTACRRPARGRLPGGDQIWPQRRVLIRRVEPDAVLLFVPQPGELPSSRSPSLSRREVEVAQLAIRGYSVANIAARLALKEQTIKTFLKRIYSKLQVRNRAELCYELLSTRSDRRSAG